ncbi:hypothetical protein LINPERHAP1_LOCUS12323 [Linum perenne]
MEAVRPSSSPPRKFKFLRDAEEKLLAESASGESESKPLFPAMAAEVREDSFLGFLYAKNSNRDAMVQDHRLPQLAKWAMARRERIEPAKEVAVATEVSERERWRSEWIRGRKGGMEKV